MVRRKNIRKQSKIKHRQRLLRQVMAAVCIPLGVAAVMAMSVFFIFIHDYLTQTDYFKLEQLSVEGSERLSHREVARSAGIRPGANILGVNLAAARKRLLAHPWIADAEIGRQIPSGLWIRIREHRPVAIVELDRRYLMNEHGELFKLWQPADRLSLPVVTGLAVGDVIAHHGPESKRHLFGLGREVNQDPSYGKPLEAVLHVLQLGMESGSSLPNRLIKQIQVDREIGLTLLTDRQDRRISLGYNDYPRKYRMLSRLLSHVQQSRYAQEFDRIDLNNFNRIVVNPVGLTSYQAREHGG